MEIDTSFRTMLILAAVWIIGVLGVCLFALWGVFKYIGVI